MTRQQTRRTLIVILTLLALAVLSRHLVRRGKVLDAVTRPPESPYALDFAAPRLAVGSRTGVLRAARELVEGRAAAELPEDGDPGRRIALISLSRAEAPALVARGGGTSLTRALEAAAGELARRATPAQIRDGRLKVDVAVERGEVQTFDGEGRARFERGLEGLWLPEGDLVLLPGELVSQSLADAEGRLDSRRLAAYLASDGRAAAVGAGAAAGFGRPGSPYCRLAFLSLIEGDDGTPVRLYRGNDRAPSVTPDSLLAAAASGGDYLLRHLRDDGTFDYRYDPLEDAVGDDYNLLRHAGTCYALIELYEATGDGRYLAAARRGLDALLATAVPPRPEDAGSGFEAILSPGNEAKLGGAALAVLALSRYRQASGEEDFAERSERLARFLLFQQEPDGRFVSKYFYGEPDPEPFESIYYPGEAVLALLRLYRLEERDEWLAAARRGADWLIGVRDLGKDASDLPHDHWLLMGLDELHDLTGEERWATHAAKIAGAILQAQRRQADRLDWVGTFYDPPRSTPTATRAEALVAMHRLARRTGADGRPYAEALLRMAAFLRRCQLTADNALYLPRPDRALGGFRRGLGDFEVRIDYVQHNLSALLGVRSILLADTVAGPAPG